MKKTFLRALLFAPMLIVSALCNDCAAQDSNRALVLYYSQGGVTQQVAQQLQHLLQADIESVELQDPYSPDYDATLERCRNERAAGIVPQTMPLKSDLSQYDTIFLGYPIWFGTYALPIIRLLNDNNLDGKHIVPFCTFGSGGLESSVADLRRALPNASVDDGYGVRASRLEAMPAEVKRFLVSSGYLAGEVEALPDYSDMRPVNEADMAIFLTACSSYKFPLGTPQRVADRITNEGIDYRFEATATMPDGSPASFTIYITLPDGDASRAQFTRVVR